MELLINSHPQDEIGYRIVQVYSILKTLQLSNITGIKHRWKFPIEI